MLAQQALANAHPFDTTGQPSAAITALVRSETLRDLEHDRVVFRHDVLREWAIGNALHVDPINPIRYLLLKMPICCPQPSLPFTNVSPHARSVVSASARTA